MHTELRRAISRLEFGCAKAPGADEGEWSDVRGASRVKGEQRNTSLWEMYQ